jgi:hypothetical protein
MFSGFCAGPVHRELIELVRSQRENIMRLSIIVAFLCATAYGFATPAPAVTGIAAIHHDGQTFVTWNDVAQGAAGANYRYRIYRSASPITDSASLASAALIQDNVFNNSGQMTAQVWSQAGRQDPTKSMSIIQQGACQPNGVCGAPLAAFTGLAVHTATADESAFYAVVTHDTTGAQSDSTISPGNNSTTMPVAETVAPVRPLKYYDSSNSKRGGSSTQITGARGRPMFVKLHASGGCPGAIGMGDLWHFWGDSSMGYQEGIQQAISVWETHSAAAWNTGGYGQLALVLQPCDTIWAPNGLGPLETFWSGYQNVPLNSADRTARYYPFSEAMQTWYIQWAIANYGADPNRVYSTGQSLGGWGSDMYSFRHPEIFAAIFPSAGNWRPPILNRVNSNGSTNTIYADNTVLMPDRKTTFSSREDMVAYALANCGNLPFVGFAIGRQDTSWPGMWPSNVAMANALKTCHAGFAFSWNNGTHSDAVAALNVVMPYYQSAFARNVSYPAFTNSSIDANYGNGDPANGDPTGCVNCGFSWNVVADGAGEWKVSVSNSLATAPMTVDITPRNPQRFRLSAGQEVKWTASTGQSGSVTADANGLATAPAITIAPGSPTTVSFAAGPPRPRPTGRRGGRGGLQ